MDAARNSATQQFYKPEPGQSMPLPKPMETLVFRAAQLHGTYFKYKDKDEDERETLGDVFQRLPDSSLGTNDNKARGKKKETCNESQKETVPLACHVLEDRALVNGSFQFPVSFPLSPSHALSGT
eukprot:jgi/Psemu1/54155/gm1.54155_g